METTREQMAEIAAQVKGLGGNVQHPSIWDAEEVKELTAQWDELAAELESAQEIEDQARIRAMDENRENFRLFVGLTDPEVIDELTEAPEDYPINVRPLGEFSRVSENFRELLEKAIEHGQAIEVAIHEGHLYVADPRGQRVWDATERVDGKGAVKSTTACHKGILGPRPQFTPEGIPAPQDSVELEQERRG